MYGGSNLRKLCICGFFTSLSLSSTLASNGEFRRFWKDTDMAY